MLVVADRDDEMLKLFDRTSGELLTSMGREGEGPEEFQTIRHFQVRRRGDAWNLWAFDTQLNRLVGYRLNDSISLLPIVSPRVTDGAPINMQWINDSTLISAGYFNEGRFWLIRKDGEAVHPFGVVPLASEDVPVFAANTAMAPSMAVRPDGDYVAVGSRYASRVDIYNTKTAELTPAAVPLPFETEMQLRSTGVLTVFLADGGTPLGYVSVAATQDRIFALFSGRSRRDYQERLEYGEQVHIFDWSGGLVGSLDLGRDILAIAVDPAGHYLYGLSDTEAAIYEYETPGTAEGD